MGPTLPGRDKGSLLVKNTDMIMSIKENPLAKNSNILKKYHKILHVQLQKYVMSSMKCALPTLHVTFICLSF